MERQRVEEEEERKVNRVKEGEKEGFPFAFFLFFLLLFLNGWKE